ncbi:hypothetical protein O3M35_013117 [Rhynocoris fuscipes]|uniref:Uncharacterized protein n=1 Tax=Rhynocoris fuscipes TaxID=488301 RepID=A0AAW1CGQ1_9HEMI
MWQQAGFKKQRNTDWSEEDDTPLSELKSSFDLYNQQFKSNPVALEEYLSIDDDLIVADYPTDNDILNKIKQCDDEDKDLSDDESALPVPVPPSNKEMRHILNKCSDYLYSKKTVTTEVYRALATLENFVDNQFFKMKQSKILDFLDK